MFYKELIKAKFETDEQYSASRRELNETVKEISKLKKCQFELQQCQDQLNCLTKEKLRMEQELASAKPAAMKADVLQRDIKMLQQSINEVEQERATLAEGLLKSNGEIQRLLAQNNSINEDKIREMRQLMKKYHDEKSQLEAQYSAKIATLESSLNKSVAEHKNLSRDLLHQKEQYQQLYGEYRAASEQLNQMLSNGATRDVELKQKNQQLEQARAALIALENELNKMETSKSGSDSTIGHLQIDLQKMQEKNKQQKDEASALIESLTTDRDQTRQKAKKLLLQQKQLTGENDKLKDKVKAMSSQLHELERIIRKLENEKNQAEGSINNLRSQLKEEQQKASTMNEQILQLSNELTQSTSDYALANQKFIELQSAYQEAENAAESAKTTLQKQLLEHEQYRNEVSQTSGTNASQINQIQAQLAGLKLDYDKVSADLVSTRNERDSTVSEMRQEIERLNLLHGDQSHTESRLVTAETELAKERENNRLKIGRLENTIERVSEELKMKSAESDQLTKQIDVMQRNAAAGNPIIEEQISNLKTENAQIIERYNGQSAELVRLSNQLNSLADERNYLDNECQRLNSLLMNFHSESSTNADLQAENERLQRDLLDSGEIFAERDRLRSELNEQTRILNNFRFTVLNEMGQDLSQDQTFKDDENLPTADRVQAAIAAYFSHQETLRRDLEEKHNELSVTLAEKDAISQKLKETQDHLCSLEQQSSPSDVNTLNAQWNEAFSQQQSQFEAEKAELLKRISDLESVSSGVVRPPNTSGELSTASGFFGGNSSEVFDSFTHHTNSTASTTGAQVPTDQNDSFDTASKFFS